MKPKAGRVRPGEPARRCTASFGPAGRFAEPSFGSSFRFAGVVFFLLATSTLEAFVSNVDSSGNSRRWALSIPDGLVSTNVVNPSSRAIRYFIAADGFSTTNTAAELNAVRACFDQWQSVSGTILKFEEGGLAPGGIDVHTSDQTNAIFWVKTNTFVNGGRDNIFGTLAVTYPRVSGNNLLLEADIVLNGAQFDWFTDFNAPSPTNRFIEASVLHEIGHFIGLDHSPVGGATLFTRGSDGLSTQAGLSRDEMAAVRALYPVALPSSPWAFLRGRVHANGNGVFGAGVVAEDWAGNVASGTVTDGDGYYQLPALEPGEYRIRVTPLDPPSNNSLTRLVTGGDIAPAFVGANTAFLAATNLSVFLAAGKTNTVDFGVARGEPPFRITRILPPAREGEPFVAINSPATIQLGQTNRVVGVYSPNLPANGATLTVTGDGLTLGSPVFVSDAFPGSNPALRLISISISVAANATPGLRSFVVQQGTNMAFANGFLEILPPFPDFNFDGLNDAFQRRYFPLFTAAAAAPGADPDGDGLSNLPEFLAGTDPTNAASVLKIEGVRLSSSGATIVWTSVPGKTYQVWCRLGFGGAVWQAQGTPITATESQTRFLDATAFSPVRFYQVLVQP